MIIHTRNTKLLWHRYELDSSAEVITIGRHPENTIAIDCDTLSRRHAQLEKRGDDWWVVDRNSTCGTLVNGERATEALLRQGDRIHMGNTIFQMKCALCEQELDQRQYSPTPIDGLTGAYNRRHIVEKLDDELRRPNRPARPLSLVLFDLDHFKRLNDANGHLAGDHLLREIVLLAQQRSRPADVFARYGGEEFVLMMPDTDLQSAAALAETIRAAIEARVFPFEDRSLSITISAGVAQADESTRSALDLIRAADDKLYEAKRGGRNRVLA